jgi:hypothetical protein
MKARTEATYLDSLVQRGHLTPEQAARILGQDPRSPSDDAPTAQQVPAPVVDLRARLRRAFAPTGKPRLAETLPAWAGLLLAVALGGLVVAVETAAIGAFPGLDPGFLTSWFPLAVAAGLVGSALLLRRRAQELGTAAWALVLLLPHLSPLDWPLLRLATVAALVAWFLLDLPPAIRFVWFIPLLLSLLDGAQHLLSTAIYAQVSTYALLVAYLWVAQPATSPWRSPPSLLAALASGVLVAVAASTLATFAKDFEPGHRLLPTNLAEAAPALFIVALLAGYLLFRRGPARTTELRPPLPWFAPAPLAPPRPPGPQQPAASARTAPAKASARSDKA